jgi:c(7)-type cytochrome triheme protein
MKRVFQLAGVVVFLALVLGVGWALPGSFDGAGSKAAPGTGVALASDDEGGHREFGSEEHEEALEEEHEEAREGEHQEAREGEHREADESMESASSEESAEHPGGTMEHPGGTMEHPGGAMEHPGGTAEHSGGAMEHPGAAAEETGEKEVADPVITFLTPKMRKSQVVFPHGEHVERLEGECSTCHPAIVQERGAEQNTMKSVHAVCKTCHSKTGEASEVSSCTSCHVPQKETTGSAEGS